MIDISIVILAHEDYIMPYLNSLESLMKQYSTELIIINETAITSDLPYPYRMLILRQDQSDFLNYVISNCIGERILLLESGFELTKSLVQFITEHLQEKMPRNIICTVKSYLTSNLEHTYEHSKIVLYDREANSSDIHYDNEVLLDYGLLHCSLERFSFYVRKFMELNDINSLFIWFHDMCKLLDPNEIDQCYTALERMRRIESDNGSALALVFLQQLKKDIYSKYLAFSCELQSGHIKDRVLNQYLSLFEWKRCCYNFLLPDALKDSLYFAWLIKDIFIAKENPLPYLCHIKSDRLQQLLSYLLETDPMFSRILQSFLEKEVLCAQKKKEVESLFTIYHTCLDYLAANIQSSRERDLVLKLYAQYKVMAKYYILKYPQFRHVFLTYQEEETTLFYHNQAYLRYISRQFPFRLSICMTVKDQEADLKRCLSSLRPLLAYDFTELIIVDTGSCDRTVSIASSYTLNVYFNTGNETLIQSRNQSILFARGEYLMILNAYETLSTTDCKKIIDFIQSHEYLSHPTYNLNIVTNNGDPSDSTTILKEPRIFQNDGKIYFTTLNPTHPTYNPNTKDLDITIQTTKLSS